MSEQATTEQQQPQESEKLRMLRELMAELSPQELPQAGQILNQRDSEIVKAIEDERTAALEIIREAIKDVELEISQDFQIQIAVKAVDGAGQIDSISYSSGTAAPARTGKTGGGSKGTTVVPPEGTVCIKTVKDVKHTLRVLKGGYLLLNDKELVNSATDATHRVLDSKTSINGRAFWFEAAQQVMEPVWDIPANLIAAAR